MIYGVQTLFGTINVVLFNNYKKYCKFLAKYGKSAQALDYYADGETECWADEDNNVWCVVLTIPSDKTNSHNALLCHEAVHCAQFIFENFGEDNPGCEEEAYLVQAIAQSLFMGDDDLRKKKPSN